MGSCRLAADVDGSGTVDLAIPARRRFLLLPLFFLR